MSTLSSIARRNNTAAQQPERRRKPTAHARPLRANQGRSPARVSRTSERGACHPPYPPPPSRPITGELTRHVPCHGAQAIVGEGVCASPNEVPSPAPVNSDRGDPHGARRGVPAPRDAVDARTAPGGVQPPRPSGARARPGDRRPGSLRVLPPRRARLPHRPRLDAHHATLRTPTRTPHRQHPSPSPARAPLPTEVLGPSTRTGRGSRGVRDELVFRSKRSHVLCSPGTRPWRRVAGWPAVHSGCARGLMVLRRAEPSTVLSSREGLSGVGRQGIEP